jgi:hypothetical protein
MKITRLILSIILATCSLPVSAAQHKKNARALQSKPPQSLSPLAIDATRKAITALRHALAVQLRQYAPNESPREDICSEIDLDVAVDDALAYLPATAAMLKLQISLTRNDYQRMIEAVKLMDQPEDKQQEFIKRAHAAYPDFKESSFLQSFPDKDATRMRLYLGEIRATAYRSARAHIDRAASLLQQQ